MSHILGIDLGSSIARAAVNDTDGPRLLAALPAVVAFPKKGDPVTGAVAGRQAYINPSRSFTSILLSLQSHRRREIDGHFYSGAEVAGVLLRELRAASQEAMGAECKAAVFSVPDSFGWEERRTLREAASLAGLHVEGFLSESCAAAVGSGIHPEGGSRILVCDAGGGSFKTAALEYTAAGSYRRLALSQAPDSGGRHFDGCIAAWLLELFRKEHGTDLSRDASAMQRIMEAAELAKCRLSENSVTTVSIPYITAEKNEALHMDYFLPRTVFYELCGRLLRDISAAAEEAAGAYRPDHLILAGGGAAIPALQDMAGRIAPPSCCITAAGADCAALGAAIAATERYHTEET